MKRALIAAAMVFLGACTSDDFLRPAPDGGAGSSGASGSAGTAGQGGGTAGQGGGAAGDAGTPQEPDFDAFAAAVEADRQLNNIPAAAVAIVRPGKDTWIRGFGTTTADGTVNDSTLFVSGGFGQQLTSLGVWRLIDQGKVDPEATVLTYLPEFNVEHGAEFVPLLKVKHLLTMSSGMQKDDDFGVGIPAWMGSDDSQLLGYLQSAAFAQNEYLQFEPGAIVFGSNRAIPVLGMIIERASGTTYVQFMEEEVLQPLGLDRAILRAEVARQDPNVVADDTCGFATDSAIGRAGGMPYISVADHAKVSKFLLEGNEAFVSSATQQLLRVPVLSTNGFSGNRVRVTNLIGLWYTNSVPTPSGTLEYPIDSWGATGGWCAGVQFFVLLPSQGVGVGGFVYRGTMGDASTFTTNLIKTALDLLGDAPGAALTDPEDPSKFERYVGTYEGPTHQVPFEVTASDGGLQIPGKCDLVPGNTHQFTCNGKGIEFFEDKEGKIEYASVPFGPLYVAHKAEPGDAGADADAQ